MSDLPEGWVLAASSFNWTPELIRAQRSARDLVVGIVADNVAEVVELEAGQVWRSFPEPADAEVDALRSALQSAGGDVSVLGVSIDDYQPSGRRRTDDERLAFLIPQLLAARRVGAVGVRLPLGQAGRPLLLRVLPFLHELDLTLYEEFQGQQTPSSPHAAPAIQVISDLADHRVRLLCDISILMPALPPSYLDRLRRGGVPADLVDRLSDQWRDPATPDAVRTALSSGSVPPGVHTLFMNLLVRFGRAEASELSEVLDLTGAYHLKFWDLDDGDNRVSGPIRDLGRLLAGSGFRGTLTSEWGGHEWLEGWAATDITRQHLSLARDALAAGAAAA
jgi:hypothetical protein